MAVCSWPAAMSRAAPRSRRQCSRHASGAGWASAFSSWRARTLWAGWPSVSSTVARLRVPGRSAGQSCRAGGRLLPYVGRELLQAAGAVGLERKLVARKVGGNGLRLIVGHFVGFGDVVVAAGALAGGSATSASASVTQASSSATDAGLDTMRHTFMACSCSRTRCQACAEHRDWNPAAVHGPCSSRCTRSKRAS